MLRAVDVILWGTKVGSVVMEPGDPIARFQYSPEILDLGIELSPLRMPLNAMTYRFPELPIVSFKGLPGLLADSLPDKFGNKVIAAWLQEEGRRADELNSLDRLAYTGTRGMGALEYRPSLLKDGDAVDQLNVDELSRLADDVLKSRETAHAELKEGMNRYGAIFKVGSSAGGARAKALIGWNEATGEVRSGQIKLPPEYSYWLIKFDGLTGNGDKEGDDKWGYGRVEYAYHLMARAAGLEMTECRLWNKRHFMTRRFDRTPDGGRLHLQTLGALAHMDFNNPLLYSYEEAFEVARRIVRDVRAEEELFRRMVFNVLAWNCDDHVKNISFLMDKQGEWKLAPAYDVSYAYNPTGDWTSRHQMSINGKRDGITDEDFLEAAKAAGVKPKKVKAIVDRVRDAIRNWPTFAAEAEVRDEFVDTIKGVLEK